MKQNTKWFDLDETDLGIFCMAVIAVVSLCTMQTPEVIAGGAITGIAAILSGKKIKGDK